MDLGFDREYSYSAGRSVGSTESVDTVQGYWTTVDKMVKMAHGPCKPESYLYHGAPNSKQGSFNIGSRRSNSTNDPSCLPDFQLQRSRELFSSDFPLEKCRPFCSMRDFG